MVDLPEPERPVKKTVKPCFGAGRWRAPQLLGHLGEGEPGRDLGPSARRRRSSVPEMSRAVRAGGHLVLGQVGVQVLDVGDHLEGTMVTPSSSSCWRSSSWAS